MPPDNFTIEISRFNDARYIEVRMAAAAPAHRGALSTALRYLYMDDGPLNLPRPRQRIAEQYMDEAERILIRWLATRTNGSERKRYGAPALIAARTGRYRCRICNYADIRALNLDHVDGRLAGTTFACLCANCHAIKSREKDWLGKARESMGRLSENSDATAG